MKRLIFVAIMLVTTLTALAQKVNFEVNVPRVVAVDEAFRVEFDINSGSTSDFNPPSFGEFNLLAGPSSSEGQSISIVNGSMTRTVNTTITYVLQAKAIGRFTMGSATIKADGKSYTTRAVSIEVVGDAAANGSSAQHGAPASSDARRPSTVSGNEIVLKVTADKTSVYKGEPIRVTTKLYTQIDVNGSENMKFPAYNGFWSQEVNVANTQWQRETLNGKVYNAKVIREMLLFPQQSGLLNIEQTSMTVIGVIVVQGKRQSVFDDFFGGSSQATEVRRNVASAPIRINVKDFPSGAPASFNGAVGQFEMKGNFSSGEIAANSSTTYTLKISGSGNLPLISAPKLTLPNSFEQYNIKTTESLNVQSSGMSGYRQFDYPYIARAEGDFRIAPIEFSFFNPRTSRYTTLTSAGMDIVVAPDSTGGTAAGAGAMVSGLSKEDLKILGQDIRFIKTGIPLLGKRGQLFYASWYYFGFATLILAIFVIMLFWLQKRIAEMRNATLMRGKKANKVVRQRFRTAEKYMKESNQRQFYEEMLKALWGYMSDKLNIPVANLTKESVREELTKRNVAIDITDRFINIISDCEYAQYSPESGGHVGEIFRSGVETISKLESLIKR